jgi:putative transposase
MTTMPNYRRAFQPGGTFFFTLVTAGRRPIFATQPARDLLHEAVASCGRRWRFDYDAGVLLPDHLHAIWTLPRGDADFSRRWALIKRTFTSEYLAAGGTERAVYPGQAKLRRRGVWQPRFYEHLIRDEDDLHRHLDYIHYNPVKHGYVACPHAWPHSSFDRYVREKKYEPTWCCTCSGHPAPPPTFAWASPDME